MCNFWYNTFWVVYIVISSTPVDEKRKKDIVGKKNCEYLRYLQSWKYGDFNQYKHEIIRRKLFLDDYRNLGNFFKIGYIFEKQYIIWVYCRTQLSRRKDGSRHDDSLPSREERRAVPSREVVVKSSPSHHLNDGVLESNFFRLFRGTNPQIEKESCHKKNSPLIIKPQTFN